MENIIVAICFLPYHSAVDKVIFWSLLYLFQVGQTPHKGQVWMSQLQCVGQPDTAMDCSSALSQTSYRRIRGKM